jgi:hypothetical protein
MSCIHRLFLLLSFIFSHLFLASAADKAVSKKQQTKDLNDNKGNTPFFLQDPYDHMCLGPNGFTVCDERALWVLTQRVDKKNTYSLVSLLNPTANKKCLTRQSGFLGLFGSDKVGLGSCAKNVAKSWDFDFIDKTHVKLSVQGQCIVRGQKKYKNSVSLQSCAKNKFLPLVYHPTPVHEAGFYLKSADGKCFDGSKFRLCDGAGANRLLWGTGIKYVWGEAYRYFFGFNTQERGLCLTASGGKLSKDDCKNNGVLGWGLRDGELSYKDGKLCVSRLADNTAVLSHCSESSEYITMDIPSFYSADDIQHLLKNQVCA